MYDLLSYNTCDVAKSYVILGNNCDDARVLSVAARLFKLCAYYVFLTVIRSTDF